MSEMVKNYPVLPLRDTVVYPYMVVPLFVGRAKTIAALEYSEKHNTDVFLVTQQDPEDESPVQDKLYDVGCTAKVLQVIKIPDGTIKILVEGKNRAMLKNISLDSGCLHAEVENIADEDLAEKMSEPLLRSILTIFDTYISSNDYLNADMISSLKGIHEPGRLADAIAMHLPIDVEDKQLILNCANIESRVEKLLGFLQREIEWVKVEAKIHDNVKSQMKSDQSKYYNQKKLDAFKKELSEDDEYAEDDFTSIEKKLTALKLMPDVKEKVFGELSKLKQMPPMSSESSVIRTYLDWVVDLPWNKIKKTNYTIAEAKAILDNDHFGLYEVKERILEFLAVQLRVKKVKGSILCLVGPPGVGKTSLGESIAKAMDRKFERIALGGVRDEAEIRGHRKTYIGAMPGRIIKAMKKAKVSNPLILLDEIDKMGMDLRGDPASALLEVLDPEQNNKFNDHYLEVDYDLSNALFITTANSLNIPMALLDRLEIIRIPGYTELEKINIAKKFLWAKNLELVGLKKKHVAISDASFRDVIRYYTQEAGVRSLERCIAKICRKVVKNEIDNAKNKIITINARSLNKYLGVKQFDFGVVDDTSHIGIARGMAWSEVGGVLLTLEVAVFAGKGNTLYTGSLGDVMKESIQAALSIVRSRAEFLNIEPDFYQKHDFHVHVPEGATPKDGPSAGVGMCLALISALTKIPVKANFAITGEITLRGEVLPIGGLKEKLLAALRGGITDVIIPLSNKKDLAEIPKEVLSGLNIHAVKWIDEALDLTLDERHKHPAIKKDPVQKDQIDGFVPKIAGSCKKGSYSETDIADK
jgi:ATP-dependent Lon protease